jgi:hypothetical protein
MIVALVGQGEAAGMTKHMGMGLEAELCFRTGPLQHPGEACGGEWPSPFGDEHKRRLGLLLPLKPSQRA